jgi:hypothetical protein
VSIPLSGQGKPLPSDFPYRGQWLLEGRMFLYIPDAEEATRPTSPKFTATVNSNQHDWSFGDPSARAFQKIFLDRSAARYDLNRAAAELAPFR